MPETMSVERRSLLKAYGAGWCSPKELQACRAPSPKHRNWRPKHHTALFPANSPMPPTRRLTAPPQGRKSGRIPTGKWTSLWQASAPGGTLSGVGEYLKERESPRHRCRRRTRRFPGAFRGTAGPHGLRASAPGFVPDTLNTEIFDEIIAVEDEEAYRSQPPVGEERRAAGGHLLRRCRVCRRTTGTAA